MSLLDNQYIIESDLETNRKPLLLINHIPTINLENINGLSKITSINGNQNISDGNLFGNIAIEFNDKLTNTTSTSFVLPVQCSVARRVHRGWSVKGTSQYSKQGQTVPSFEEIDK